MNKSFKEIAFKMNLLENCEYIVNILSDGVKECIKNVDYYANRINLKNLGSSCRDDDISRLSENMDYLKFLLEDINMLKLYIKHSKLEDIENYEFKTRNVEYHIEQYNKKKMSI